MYPMVYDGTTCAYPNVEDPEYHFTTDMTNQALAWMNTRQSLTPTTLFTSIIRYLSAASSLQSTDAIRKGV